MPFMHVCMCSLPVCWLNALAFVSLDLESSFLVRCTHVHLHDIQDDFGYQGHRVKVKVTEAKSVSVYPSRGWSAFDWKAVLLVL